jgi:hypothetical protein
MILFAILIYIPRLKEIFGEDADVFNPDRWARDLDSKNSVGVYANM